MCIFPELQGVLKSASIVACAIFAFIPQSVVADSVPVYWSGFAYQGDFATGAERYPFTSGLLELKDGEMPILNRTLKELVERVSNESFFIETEKYGQLGPDASSSVALAFVLDRETVSVEQFGNEYKLLVELSAQALFFDFKEMSVLASYPIIVQYIDVLQNPPGDSDVRPIVDGLYLGGVQVNIFDEFIETLTAAELNLNVNRRLQVTDVSVGEEVKAQLPPEFRTNTAALAESLGREFSSKLSANQNIPVLPFTKGYAIGNVMAMRFADQSVLNLKIPEPDYEIRLDLKKLVRIEYSKVAAGTTYIYGSYLHVNVVEPLSGRPFLDRTIKFGAIKKVPATQRSVDDWPAYQDSLSGLIHEFAAAISSPDKDWAKKHIGEASATDELLAFSQVVTSCR